MTEPELSELAAELEDNPRLFAYRIAELISDVRDLRDQVRKGSWLALTVLIGVVVDLALRLVDQGTPAKVTSAVVSLLT